MASGRVILGTSGHIDHGKTTIVRALTGIDTDRLPQEKERGITIDLGFAHLDIGDLRVGIVDVPGHERFVRTMLAGASGIDMVMLVVAADDGVMPQTREHLAIVDLMGVSHGLVCLSKCDLVDEEWLDLVEQEVRELLRGSRLEGAPFVRTSARTGTGLEDLRRTIDEIARSIEEPPRDEPFRLSIDRSFVQEGVGTIVTGSVASGSVRVGDTLRLLCADRPVRVRGLQSHGEAVGLGTRGMRLAIHLGDVHHSEIRRGDELATAGLMHPTRILSVRLRMLDDVPQSLRHRMQVRVHLGTRDAVARVRLLEGTRVEAGSGTLAQFFFEEAVCATPGQAFVMRSLSPARTLGGGRVLQTNPAPIRRRDRDAIAHLASLDSDDPCRRIESACWFFPSGASPDPIVRNGGVAPSEGLRAIADLRSRGVLVEVGDRLLHADRRSQIERRIARHVARAHESGRPGLETDALMAQMPDIDPPVLRRVVDSLVTRGDLFERGGRLSDRTHEESSAYDERLCAILTLLGKGGFAPPMPEELARALDLRIGEVRALLRLAVERGRIEHFGGALFLDRAHADELMRILREALGNGGGISVSDFRQLLGTSRKYAVPMLEALDKRGITRRVGDLRTAGPRLGEGEP